MYYCTEKDRMCDLVDGEDGTCAALSGCRCDADGNEGE
jgi:hypothetical protein